MCVCVFSREMGQVVFLLLLFNFIVVVVLCVALFVACLLLQDSFHLTSRYFCTIAVSFA